MRTWKKLLLEGLAVIIGILFLTPFYFLLINSVKSLAELAINTAGWPVKFVWTNYSQAWKIINFPKAFLNSAIVSVLGVAGITIFSSMGAYRIARKPSKFNHFALFVLVSAMVIPFQSIMIPLSVVAKKLGLLNELYGLAVIYWGLGVSLSIFLFQGFIRTISYELEESAIIDGCGPYKVFLKIVFPLLKPMTVTVIILNSLWVWNDFLLPSLILSDIKLRTIPLASFYFFSDYLKQWDLGLATLVLSISPLFLFFLLLQKHVIDGITAGSVKG